MMVNSMLANHEQPAVLSAVMKSQTTHRARLVMNDAMDVMGGAGICRGKNNMLGNQFMGMPIAITVEGANILTRSMITFGQGLNRAHPNLIKIVDTLEKGDDLKGFTKEAFGFLGHLGANTSRSLTRAVMRPRSRKNLPAYYEAQLGRLSSNFALSADLALVLGGRLKFEEMLSGRFADAFGTLYLGYSCLWYYKQLEASGKTQHHAIPCHAIHLPSFFSPLFLYVTLSNCPSSYNVNVQARTCPAWRTSSRSPWNSCY
jgi:acyl-CoA dehydrogenase